MEVLDVIHFTCYAYGAHIIVGSIAATLYWTTKRLALLTAEKLLLLPKT